jgi:hypothetical protein
MLVGMTRGSIKYIAYQSAKRPVSNFMKRRFKAFPDQSWDEIKNELKIRFAGNDDPKYASLLRKVKQKPCESFQVFLERLMDLSEDCFE